MVSYVIALYIRLSTEDSKVGSFSLENQKNALHQYVDTMEGVKNAEVLEFIDNGYSGTNFERPAVQELLDQIREGKINCIVVKDFTRFGRNSIEVGYFMEMVFPLYGVRFISINDNFDSDTLHGDTGGINVAFKYLVGEFYSRDLSIKYKSAKYVKFRRGEYQSKTCPYGYRKGADGRMEPNEETAPNVRLIFELALEGYGPGEVGKELFRRGICTPGEYKAAHSIVGHDVSRCNGVWPASTVIRILDDERYTGTYIIGKREVTEVGGHRVRMKEESQWVKIPDHHPAIISKELFDQVQAQRSRFKCPKKNARAYPLRGKVFCGCCHHAMPRTANKNHYFQCRHSKVNEAASCHGLMIFEAELEGMLYEILSKQAQVILNVADLSNAGQLDIQIAQQAEYDKQINRCLDQKRALYEQFILKQITVEDYKSQKAAVDSELDRLREIHSNLKAQTSQMDMDEKAKSARTELARETVGAGGLTAGLADTLIDRVYVYPNNQVEIIWKMKDKVAEKFV
jgi:DNA invertase Pin-like site-specific DNA recombinase